MNHQILLINYVENETFELRNKLLAADPKCVVDTALNMRQGFQRLAQRQADLIVMNFDLMNDVVFKHVRNLKAVVDTVPLLVIGKAEQLELRNRIANVVHTLVLERPYTDKDLSGLVNTIFGPGTIYQREHRRFSTAQPAFVEVYGKNVESESMMLNLSRGGAYVELPNTDEIVIGDLMRLMIDLDEMKTNYRMHAKVVWAGGPTRAGHRGFGVEFIRPGDVFREMQNR